MKTVVAYARWNVDRLELRREPSIGFKPLVYAEPWQLERQQDTRIDVNADRKQMIIEYLGLYPSGASSNEMRRVLGLKNVLRVLDLLRADDRVRYWPKKSRGCVWYLPQHEALVMANWEQAQAAKLERDRARELARYHRKQAQKTIDNLRAPNSVWQLGEMT